MRILHVNPWYVPVVGGAEIYLKELSEGLASRGHDVTVLTTNVRSLWDLGIRRCGALPNSEVINGVKVIRVNPDDGLLGKAFNRWLRLKGGYRSLSFLLGHERIGLLSQGFRPFSTIQQILRVDAEIVTSLNWYCAPAYYTYLARKLKRFAMVGVPLFHTAEAWCDRDMHKKMLAACDAVIANTAHEAQFVRQQAATRIEVAGVGTHPKAFDRRNGSEIRARYGLGNFPVVGFVGRQLASKGATALLQAMKTVWQWNREVRLVLAGPAPPGANDVETLLQGFTAAERERIVRINEFSEQEKASLYDAFDVFALPSISESFGIVYLEAWLCGKPVIGARAGSTPSVIHEGTDGLLVDPQDTVDLARAIIDLLWDPHKRDRLGKNGQAKTLAQFTWEKVTDRVEKLYLELSAGKAPRRLSPLRVGQSS